MVRTLLEKLVSGFVGGSIAGLSLAVAEILVLLVVLLVIPCWEVLDLFSAFIAISVLCGPCAGMSGNRGFGAILGLVLVTALLHVNPLCLAYFVALFPIYSIVAICSGGFAGWMGGKSHELWNRWRMRAYETA